MTITEHDKLRDIAEQVVGETLPNKTSGYYLEKIRQNIGQGVQESTGTDYTVTSPNLDTLAVDTSDGAVTVTLAETWQEIGRVLTVTDVTNNAATYNITVTAENATIDGQSSVTIDVNGGAVDIEVSTDTSGNETLTITGTVGQIL